MKNLHLLPTEDIGMPQNIYITSDEETKENTWCVAILSGQVFKNINRNLKSPDKKKIILTTDLDLINDGVQAIDDTFLEWFVKNPGCEYVKWNAYPISPNGNVIATVRPYPFVGLISNFRIEYEIIIPQEEARQNFITSIAPIGFFPSSVISGNVTSGIEPVRSSSYYIRKPKQETLEEAAVRIAYDSTEENKGFPQMKAFINGAKWQAERMYTEEDMKLSFETGRNFQLTGENNFNELIEQFKNK